ncbi:MAG: PH domain-containing protein [Acidimicrobiales bacterium]
MTLPSPPFLPDPSAAFSSSALPSAPRRLHPLSPVVRIGRAAVAFLYVAATAVAQSRSNGHPDYVIDVVILVATVVAGFVSWVVTTWSVEGSTMQVSTGLIRRKVVRLPLSRVQAVDLVEPWLARLLGLAEVRVRTGGGADGDARLQYLKVSDAQAVRTALVALVHGLPGSTPEAPEHPLVRVNNRLLVLSTLLTGGILSSLAFIVLEVVLFSLHETVLGTSLLLYLFAALSALGRRIANEWGLAVSESPDGLRLKAGLGSRVRETIPPNRIQAVHRVEPLFWRGFGWQRLELHLAGGVAHRRNQPRAVVRRALLPVGLVPEADLLLSRLLGRTGVGLSRPPRRGRVRSPFSFHFLSAGHDGVIAESTSGRVCRRTEMIPLAKVQSIHYVQGPFLRALGLATVHVVAAGHGASVSWRQWDASEARSLVDELTAACASARELDLARAAAHAVPGQPPPPPPGQPPPASPAVAPPLPVQGVAPPVLSVPPPPPQGLPFTGK